MSRELNSEIQPKNVMMAADIVRHEPEGMGELTNIYPAPIQLRQPPEGRENRIADEEDRSPNNTFIQIIFRVIVMILLSIFQALLQGTRPGNQNEDVQEAVRAEMRRVEPNSRLTVQETVREEMRSAEPELKLSVQEAVREEMRSAEPELRLLVQETVRGEMRSGEPERSLSVREAVREETRSLVSDIRLAVQQAVREEIRRAEPVRNTGTAVSRGTRPIPQTHSGLHRQTDRDCMCCFRDCTCICHSRNFRGNPCGRNVRKHKRVRRQEEYQQGELHNHAALQSRDADYNRLWMLQTKKRKRAEGLKSKALQSRDADYNRLWMLQTKKRKRAEGLKSKACQTSPNYPHWNDPSSRSDDPDLGNPDKGTWQKALEDENETMMMTLIQDGTLPSDGDLQRVFNLYRHNSITTTAIDAICSKVCQHIQVSCDRIKSVYASYTADKPENLVFVVMADEDVQLDTDYSYIVCHPGGYSQEGSNITYHEIRRKKRITSDESDKIAAAIQEHSEGLFAKHSNIHMISGCSVKSRGFGTEHSVIDTQTCIVIYVGVKGQIPLHETPFPDKIAVPGTDIVFPVDVREGEMRFFGKPGDFHQNLKMGCEITDKTSAGTLGAIIEGNNGQTYCLTSAHVFFENQNKDLLNKLKEDPGEYRRPEQDRTRDIFVYQYDPNKPEGREPFGVVAYAVFKKGNNHNAGVDIAVIDITDQSRIPIDGSFPEGNMEPLGFSPDTPMVYTKGEIFDKSSFRNHIERHTEVVKYGSTTGYTKGVFDMQGLCVKRIDYTDHTRNIILNNQLVVLSVGDPNTNPFAQLGDSGALVFAKYEGNRHDLRAVGIVEGGTTNNMVAVTPIWDVFAYLNRNPQSGLKKFEPLSRIDSGYMSFKTYPTLLQSIPCSADVNEQVRSQEIAEHFLESQQKQTREFSKLEDLMNTRLEKIENTQREQQEKTEQAHIQRTLRLEHIERLTENMQREQQEKNDQLQNQQKTLEDKMTQMMGMMQELHVLLKK